MATAAPTAAATAAAAAATATATYSPGSFAEACATGNFTAVLNILKTDFNAHSRKEGDKLPIEIAAAAGHTDIVNLLRKLPAGVLQLGNALQDLEKEVSEDSEKVLHIRTESEKKVNELEIAAGARYKELWRQIQENESKMKADVAAERAQALEAVTAANSQLEVSSVLLNAARSLDSDYTQRLTRNLTNLSDEEVYILLQRAGVNIDLQSLRDQMVNGEVLVHNYKDPNMLTSIGIKQLGQRLRCQQLVEQLLQGKSFASLRCLQNSIPDGRVFDGSFETLTPARVAEYAEHPRVAEFIREHLIAGDVLDHPKFSEMMHATAGNTVPYGAMSSALTKLRHLVDQNPRTDFVAPSLNECREKLGQDPEFVDKNMEIATRMQALGSNLPSHVRDPISGVAMYSAVTTDDGTVYDSHVITGWFALLRRESPNVPSAFVRLTSPVTGAVITNRLQENTSINNSIAALTNSA